MQLKPERRRWENWKQLWEPPWERKVKTLFLFLGIRLPKNKGGMWWKNENHACQSWKPSVLNYSCSIKTLTSFWDVGMVGLGSECHLKEPTFFYNKISNFSDSHPGESDWVILKFVKSRGGGTEKSQTCIPDFSNSRFERTLRESRSDPMTWNPERRKCPWRIGNSLKWDSKIRKKERKSTQERKIGKSKETNMDISKTL